MSKTRLALLLATTAGAAVLAAGGAHAQVTPVTPNPTGAVITSGTNPADTAGTLTTVTQSQDRVVIDWNSFNVGTHDGVRFDQPSTTSIAFNRINSASLTTINGALDANGQVWLFAPGGLLFGSGARVNVGSLVASTGDFSDDDALDGGSVRISGGAGSLTVDPGAQISTDAGYTVLHAPNLAQNGAITAGGNVALIAGDGATLTPTSDQSGRAIIGVQDITAASDQGVITHGGSTRSGTATAQGDVRMTAMGSTPNGDGFSSVINLGGYVEATGLNGGHGFIILGAQGNGSLVQTSAAQTTLLGHTSIFTDNAILGALDATGALNVYSAYTVNVTGQVHVRGEMSVYTFQASNTNGASTGDITIGANMIADGGMSLSSARDITIAQGVTLQSDADGDGLDGFGDPGGDLSLRAGRDVLGGGSILLAGSSIDTPTAGLVVSAGLAGEGGLGGDIELGDLYASTVRLTAYSQRFFDSDADAEYRRGGNITVGGITALGDIAVTSNLLGAPTTSLISFTGPITSFGSLSVFNYNAGNVRFDADATLGRNISVLTNRDILLADGITLRADADGSGNGGVFFTAGRDVLGTNAALAAGLLGEGPTGDIKVSAGQTEGEQLGGDIALGPLSGVNITLNAYAGGGGGGGGLSRGGNIDLYGTIFAVGDFNATVSGYDIPVFDVETETFSTQYITTGGHIRFAAGAPVTANGTVTVLNNNGGDIGVDADITADGSILLRADRDITIADGLTLEADRDMVGPTSEIVLEAGRDVVAPGARLFVGGFVYDENGDPLLNPTGAISVTGGSGDRGQGAGNVSLGSLIGDFVLVQAASNSVFDPETETSSLYGGAINIGSVISFGDVGIGNEARGAAPNVSSITVGGISAAGGVDIYNGDFGDIALNGSIDANTYVLVRTGANVTLADFITVRADADGTDTTGEPEALEIRAGGDVLGRFANLATGRSDGDPTTDITVSAGEQLFDSAPPGGSIEIGGLRGGVVTLGARANGDGISDPHGGSIGVFGDVVTTGDFFATVSYEPSGSSTHGAISFADGIVARIGGGMQLTNVNLGDLTIGAGTDIQAVNDINFTIDRSILADATSRIASTQGDLDVQAGRAFLDASDITLGDLFGGFIVIHTSGGDITLNGRSQARADLSVNGGFGSENPTTISINGDVVANGQVSISNFDGHVRVGEGVTIQSDADGDGFGGSDGQYDGGLYLTASQNLTAGAGSMLLAGIDLSHLTADVFLTAGASSFRFGDPLGGDLTVYGAAGQNVYLYATAGAAGLGNIVVRGNLTGADLVSIETFPFSQIIGCEGQCLAPTSGALGEPAPTGTVTIDPNVVIQGDSDGDGFGGVSILAFRDVLGDPTSLLLSGADEAHPSGYIQVVAGYADFGPSAGGSVTLGRAIARNITVEADAGQAGGGSVTLLGDMSALDSLVVFAYGFDGIDPETEDEIFRVGDISIGAGVTMRANADGDSNGGMGIYGDRNVSAAADSLLITGAVGGPAVGDVEIFAGEGAAYFGFGGGDLTTGRITAENIRLGASLIDQGGGITVGGVLTAVNNITIANRIIDPTAPCGCEAGAQSAPPPPPAMSILADMTAGGDIALTAMDEIYVEAGVTVRANDNGDAVGGLFLHAARSITALAGSALGAGAAGMTPVGDVEIIAGYPVPRVNAVGGNLVTAAVFGGDVTLEAHGGAGAAGSATINGPVDAGNLDLTADDFVRLGNTASRGYVHATAGTDFTVIGAVAAAADVALDAQRGTLSLDPGASVRSDSDGAGGGALALRASGNLTMGAGSLVATGAGGGPATTDATLIAGQAFGLGGPDAGDLTIANTRVNNLLLTANRAGAVGGSLSVIGNATAAGNISGSTFRTVTLGAGSVLRADADGAGGGDVTLFADGAFSGAASSLVASGAAGLPGTGTVQLQSGLAGAGGDLTLGSVSGGNIVVIAGPLANLNVQGSITATVGGTASATQAVTVDAITAGTTFFVIGGGAVLLNGPISTGSGGFRATSTGAGVAVNGPVTSLGNATFEAEGLGAALTINANVIAADLITAHSQRGAVTLAGGVTLRGDSDGTGGSAIDVSASANITVGVGALLTSGLSGGSPTGTVGLIAGFTFGLGGPDAGNLTFTGATVNGGSVNLVAGRSGAVGGVINAGSASATQQLNLTGYDVNLVATSILRGDSDGVGAGGLTITARHDVNGAAGSLVTSGPIGGPGRGAVSVTAGSGGGGGSMTLGDIGGGFVTLNAVSGAGGVGDITVLGALSGAGGVSLTASRDASVVGALTTGGDADLTAFRNLTLASASATGHLAAGATTGNLLLTGPASAGGFLSLNALSGSVTANGALTAGTDLTANASTLVQIGAGATAGGAVNLSATRGDVTVVGLIRGDSNGDGVGGVTIRASRNVTATSATLVAGLVAGLPTADIAVTGGYAFGLGGPDAGSLSFTAIAGRNVTLTARRAGGAGGIITAGTAAATEQLTLSGYDINLAATSTLRGDSDGAGVGGLTITATHDVNGAAGSLVASGLAGSQGRGALSVTAGSGGAGGSLTLGDVSGGFVTLNAVSGAGGPGDVTILGALNGGTGVSLTASRDASVLGALTTGGDADLTAFRNLTLASASATGHLAAGATTGNLLLTGPASAGSFLSLNALSGSVTANGALTAGTDLTANASTLVQIGAGATAGGAVNLSATRGDVTVAGLIRGDSNGDGVGGVTIRASRNVTATSATLFAGPFGGLPTADIAVTAGYAFGLGGPDAGNLTFNAIGGRNATLTARRAGGAGGIITVGTAAATEQLTLSGYDVNLASTSTLLGDSDGAGVGGLTVTATHDVNAAAGSLVASGLAAGPGRGALSVTAGAGGAGGSMALGNVRGGTVVLTAQSGAGGPGDLTVLGATTSTGSATLIAARNLTLGGALTAGSDAVLTAGGTTTLAAATVGGFFSLTGGGDVTLGGPITTTDFLVARSTGGTLRVNGALTAGTDIGLGGANVIVNGSATANRDIEIESSTGDVLVNSLVRADADGVGGGDLTIVSARDVTATALLRTGLTTGPGTGAILITAGAVGGGNASIGAATAGRIDVLAYRLGASGGGITINGQLNAVSNIVLHNDVLSPVVGSVPNGAAAAPPPPPAISILAGMSAGGDITVTSIDAIYVETGVTVRANDNGDAVGALTFHAARNIDLLAGSRVGAGGSGLTPVGAVEIIAGYPVPRANGVGGDLTAYEVFGGNVRLEARSGSGAAGNATINGPVDAANLDVVASGSGLLGAATSRGYVHATAGANFTINGPVTAAAEVAVNAAAGTVILGPGAIVRADSDGNGSGLLTVQAGGDVLADPTSLLVTGLASGLPTTNITVTAGGGLTLGGLRALNATLSGQAITIVGDASALQSIGVTGSSLTLASTGVLRADADGNGTGAFTFAISGGITGAATSLIAIGTDANPTGILTLGSTGGSLTLGRMSAGRLVLSAPSASGRVTLLGAGVGVNGIDIFAGAGVRVASLTAGNGLISLRSSGDVAVSAGAIVNGAAGLTVDAGTLLTVEANALLSGGYGSGAPGAATWPNAPSPLLGGVRVTAADIDLRGSIRAYSGTTGLGDVFIAIRNAGSTAVVGGETGAGGFHLSNSEFGRISGRNVVITAGALNAPSGDLIVRDLTLGNAGLSGLWLGGPGTIRITGSISAPGTAVPEVRVGFLLPTFSTSQTGVTTGFAEFVPTSVILTGSLGGDGGLGQVGIVARGDVLIGDDAFVTAASSSTYRPSRNNASNTGRIQVHALGLQFATSGRILQQNTGSTVTFAGLRIGAPTADRPLITWFSFLGTTPTPPSIIDLYGAIEQADGTYLVDRRAADTPHLLSSSLTVIDDYKFNTCTFGRASSCVFTPTFQDPFVFIDTSWFDQPTDVLTILLDLPDADEEEERLYIGVPITGSGNEDLWFGTDREPGR